MSFELATATKYVPELFDVACIDAASLLSEAAMLRAGAIEGYSPLARALKQLRTTSTYVGFDECLLRNLLNQGHAAALKALGFDVDALTVPALRELEKQSVRPPPTVGSWVERPVTDRFGEERDPLGQMVIWTTRDGIVNEGLVIHRCVTARGLQIDVVLCSLEQVLERDKQLGLGWHCELTMVHLWRGPGGDSLPWAFTGPTLSRPITTKLLPGAYFDRLSGRQRAVVEQRIAPLSDEQISAAGQDTLRKEVARRLLVMDSPPKVKMDEDVEQHRRFLRQFHDTPQWRQYQRDLQAGVYAPKRSRRKM